MKLETLHNTAHILADWSILLMKQWNDDLSDQLANSDDQGLLWLSLP